MQATIILLGRCPVCGYRNRGYRWGNLRPGMRTATLRAGSLVVAPWECGECGHPMHPQLYDRLMLDQETTAALRAWQERQQAKRQARGSVLTGA